jgi:Mn2+/Fe2+ NRAMP family transporter
MYSTFVRVLHYHLKDKSGAIYSSGCSKTVLWKWGIFSIIPAFIFSFTIDYLGYGLINPYALTLIITGVSAIAVLFLQFGQWPKEYNATDIPLNLLP